MCCSGRFSDPTRTGRGEGDGEFWSSCPALADGPFTNLCTLSPALPAGHAPRGAQAGPPWAPGDKLRPEREGPAASLSIWALWSPNRFGVCISQTRTCPPEPRAAGPRGGLRPRSDPADRPSRILAAGEPAVPCLEPRGWSMFSELAGHPEHGPPRGRSSDRPPRCRVPGAMPRKRRVPSQRGWRPCDDLAPHRDSRFDALVQGVAQTSPPSGHRTSSAVTRHPGKRLETKSMPRSSGHSRSPVFGGNENYCDGPSVVTISRAIPPRLPLTCSAKDAGPLSPRFIIHFPEGSSVCTVLSGLCQLPSLTSHSNCPASLCSHLHHPVSAGSAHVSTIL